MTKWAETASEVVENLKLNAKKYDSELQTLKIKNLLVPMASKFIGLAYMITPRDIQGTWV